MRALLGDSGGKAEAEIKTALLGKGQSPQRPSEMLRPEDVSKN